VPSFDDSDADTLAKELMKVPTLSLGTNAAALQELALVRAAQGKSYPGPLYLRQRLDLLCLPLKKDSDAQLSKEAAEELHVMSVKLRTEMTASIPTGDVRPDPEKLKSKLNTIEWRRSEVVPCLLQMLQAEDTPIRKVLIEQLKRLPGPRSTQALAMRAMTEIDKETRHLAVTSLKDREEKEYLPLLTEGLYYPWLPVVAHAAEALAFLKGKACLPELAKAYEEPDPALPFKLNSRSTAVRELVKVSHLGNCVLCHAPSLLTTDFVRGAVPDKGLPIPGPSSAPAYGQPVGRGTQFVRADITYLRQDFSVTQPVSNNRLWPKFQRFDYMLRTRQTTPQERKKGEELAKTITPQKEVLLKAIERLSGKKIARGDADQRLKSIKSLTEPAVPKEPGKIEKDWTQFIKIIRVEDSK
jgi:HEAT repeat protein